MLSLPRIMVVDHLRDVGRVVRSTLGLLNHLAIVVEVPTGEEAMLELQRAPFSILVSAYELPGMNGLELCNRATIDVPEIKAIVLANAYDELPGEDVPFTVLVKPLAADQFVRVFRRALGQEVEEAALAGAAGPAIDLGPVPEVDLGELRGVLTSVLTDVGAMAAVLMDRTGEVLLERGAVGYLDREKLAATLAPHFADMVRIGEVVGGDIWGMHFWDGNEFDIYGLSVGLHHFVCLVFEGTTGSRALGPVSMYGRRAVEEMVKLIGSVAFEVAKPAEPLAPKPGVKPKAEPEAAPEALVPEPTPEPAPRRKRKPAPPPPKIEVDDATLQEALSKTEAVDADDYWDTLEGGDELTGERVVGEGALSFEEALQLGLLPPELGGRGG